MTHTLNKHKSQGALLRRDCSITTQNIKSLCCVAAGITALWRSTTEARIPQEKLREAATTDTTLIAQFRSLAQLVVGYRRTPEPPDPTISAKKSRYRWSGAASTLPLGREQAHVAFNPQQTLPSQPQRSARRTK